jgi:hypothetical protein
VDREFHAVERDLGLHAALWGTQATRDLQRMGKAALPSRGLSSLRKYREVAGLDATAVERIDAR